MKRACIAVVDASRARIYDYAEEREPGDELREVRDLVNPGRRMRAGEMFSEARPSMAQSGALRRHVVGAGRSDAGVPSTTYDDHRFAHISEMDSKFAKLIVDEVDRFTRAEQLGRLILVASPKMLGALRKQHGILHRNGLVVDEVTADLTNLSVPQLHDRLASLELVPPRQRLNRVARQ